jgi:Bacterial Ig domain
MTLSYCNDILGDGERHRVKAEITIFRNSLCASILFLISLSGCSKDNPIEPIPTTPVVSILSPTQSEVIGDSVKIQVSATDDKGITKVEIYIDNQIPQGGTLLIAPYIFIWNAETLADSSAHSLYAKGYDADGNVSSTPVMTLVAYKLAPTQLQATFLSDTVASLTWQDNSRKETGFEIERKINTGDFELVKTVSANVANSVVPGIYIAGDNISFRIRATGENIKSKYSNTITKQFTFPSPSSLTVTSITETSVQLQWQNTNSMATKIYIERSVQAQIGFILVDSISTSSTTKSITGVYSFDTTYYFRVYSKSTLNRSASTSAVSAVILFPAPSNLQVTATRISGQSLWQIYLSWTDNSSFETAFEVEYDKNNVTWLGEGGLEIVGANVVISTNIIVASGVYYFRVRAITTTRQSGYSNVVSVSNTLP